MTESVFYKDWASPNYLGKSGLEAMLNDFEIDLEAIAGADILFAQYEIDGYEGSAYVLFSRDGKLFEVVGGHCSCDGLEGQWEPEEVAAEALRHRLMSGEYFSAINAKDTLLRIVDGLSASN
ncbi:hypothetical protein [Devosia sp. DBB001]|nr:hypothetical protein [Devosia sp. DBB001]